ncbi:MAG: DUF374 domain-containing protein [Dorea sp.]|nr:DUF374 domain-containing protein [Dorea sp.]
MGQKMLSRIFYIYLKCLERTVQIEWIHPEVFTGHHVVGFWHEDSFAMNLVLKTVTDRGNKMSVLVTGDARGEYIRDMVEKCRGDSIRICYGFGDLGTIRDILDALREPERSVAIAMDGPLGPRHIPKKMTYFLSEKGRTSLVGVTLSYSGKLSLKGRWDHYRIPLPFSRIKIRFDDYGIVSSRCMPQLRTCLPEDAAVQVPDGAGRLVPGQDGVSVYRGVR